ncbi:SDR family NAD(P)-dependent oxidoreductase [Acaryochloris sp. CCMEE 5410]|uniref:SDR family NAD(P)-dependent oxidoreductase n=1 Tax=Acaryochloris sp. CCMEE 5410 TaxID=310037 RepID=UPI0002484ECD|nr:SDR family oxidoreductase [Acaryochloris sp. CCMEE 5410]KAI9132291.1 SDR family oxidoreductase [Acaryochloris sp. CCMEE 5410]
MDLGLKNKVAVITGGDSGMGKATAERLLKEGAKVALIDKTQEELEKTVKHLKSLGDVFGTQADLTHLAEVESAKQQVLQHYGKVHILMHAAGITGATGDFLDICDEDWEKTIAVDLMATVRVCRAFIPVMQAEQWGRIVLVTSEDAIQPYTDEMPYCACKAAVLNFAKNLSKAYAQDGILVNSVSPAFIATPMTDAMMEQRAEKLDVNFDEAIASFLKEKRPHLELKRRGKPQEVAAVIAFLCSELSSFVVGANYRVDGGSVATI